MGFQMRKSFKVAPGVRMTITPKGFGVSAGGRVARMSMNTSGRVSRTLSVPGTGISHVKTYGTSTGKRPARASVRTSAKSSNPSEREDSSANLPVRPGLFAPKWEKTLFKAASSGDAQAVQQTYLENPDNPSVSWIAAAANWLPALDWGSLHRPLEKLWQEGFDPSTDPFASKYFSENAINLSLTDVIQVSVPPNREALGLLLAEVRQAIGDLDGAIDLVEGLTPTTLAAVSLAELYVQSERWSDVVDLTDDLKNVDELATYLLIQRGIALRELGFFEASREALKFSLAPRSRPTGLRHLALVERSRTYFLEGKKAAARKDLERILAENSAYPGLREQLASLAGG